MTDIGELVVRIKADAAQLQQELNNATTTTKESASQMTQAFEGVKGALEALGIAFGVAEIKEFVSGALEGANNMYIMAQRIGFASDTLSALNIPLKQNGSNIDEFSNSVKFMNRNVELAAEGNTMLLQRFDDLGLSVTKLKALTPEEQFNEIANALSNTADQGRFTADGMAILGRGFASIAPLIKAANGNLEEWIETQKNNGSLTTEEIAKIHEYDDAWVSFIEHLKIKAAEGAIALHELWDEVKKFTVQGMPGYVSPISTDRPNTVNEATFLNQGEYGDSFPSLYADQVAAKKKSAKGNNNDIVSQDAETTKDAAEQLGPYIEKLNEEAAAAELSQKALFVKRAEIEATTKAQNDYNNDLRDSADLTAEETQRIDAAAAALYDHKEALAQNKQIADQLSNSLTKIIMNFKDMKSAVTDLLQSIAQEMIKTQISKPLATSITGSLPSISGGFGSLFSGIGKILGFADGGSPPVGVPSIVGENGPELFIPSQAGTIIPNGAMGGGSVAVYQTFNMQPGLPETVGAAIRQAAPQIAAMAHTSIAADIQNGGPLSRIVGRKS